MHQFIKKLLLLFLSLLTMLLVLDLYLINNLSSYLDSADEVSVWSEIREGKIDCEIGIYGSSRAWNHIDPQVLEDKLGLSAYNFGIDGHNFRLQYLRHLKFMQSGVKPKIIVHSADVFTFERREKLYNRNQFIPSMLWDFETYYYTSPYKGFEWVDYVIPLVRFRHLLSIRNPLNENSSISRKKGFYGLKGSWTDDFEKSKEIWGNYEVKFDSETLEMYEEFLSECKNENIQVVIVYTPEFIEGQSFVINRAEVVSKFKGFAKKYEIVFLDYSDSFLSDDKYCFYNVSHLNEEGALVFSNVLADDLLEVLSR
jgi:hypothetical protein